MASLIHATAHGMVAGDTFRFANVDPTDTGVDEDTTYYVIAAGLTADAFEFSETLAGPAFTLTNAMTDGSIVSDDTYEVVTDGIMDPPTTPTTLSAPTVVSALHNNIVRLTVTLPDTSEAKSRAIDVAVTKVVSASGDQLTGNISDNGGVARWFDADLHTWATCLNHQSKIFSTTAAKTFTRIRISWHYGGLFNQDGTAGAASGASGPFTVWTGPSITGPWTALVSDSADPAVTNGITYPNDFAVNYEVPETTAQFFKFSSDAAGNNDLYELEAQAFTTDWTKAHIYTVTDGTATFSVNALGDTAYAVRTRVQDVFGQYGAWSPAFVHTTLAGADGLKAKNADDHIADTTAAHAAASLSYAGASGISATDVEGALDELAAEKADIASAVMDGDTAGGDLSGTYPNPSVVDDSHAHTSATAPGTTQRAAASTTPAAVSTVGAVGTGATDARDDHVHAHEAAHIAHDTLWDAKGDMVIASAADTAIRVAVGSDGKVWTADTASSGGAKWADPAGGAPTGAAGGDLSGTYPNPSVVDSSHDHNSTTAPGVPLASQTLWAAKGDLVVGTANDTAAILSVGADDTIPMADAAASTGIKWVAAGSPSAVGTAAATGTADTFTRGDHVHAHEAAHTAHDTVWDAAGDLIVGTGADTAAKLAITVPAANILNVLGVVNGETTWSVKSVHDSTAPVTQAMGDAAAAGTALTAAHRDHTHGMPSTQTISNAAQATSFPGSPATNDRVYRTDKGLEFFYDGTRWLSTELFYMPIPPQVVMNNGLAATTAAANRSIVPIAAGGTNIYIVDHVIDFFVNGGTALGASHKWVGTFDKVDTSNAATTIATDNIASGSSSVWRQTTDAVNALLGTTSFVLQSSWTKTGTPGNLLIYEGLTYRVVTT